MGEKKMRKKETTEVINKTMAEVKKLAEKRNWIRNEYGKIIKTINEKLKAVEVPHTGIGRLRYKIKEHTHKLTGFKKIAWGVLSFEDNKPQFFLEIEAYKFPPMENESGVLEKPSLLTIKAFALSFEKMLTYFIKKLQEANKGYDAVLKKLQKILEGVEKTK